MPDRQSRFLIYFKCGSIQVRAVGLPAMCVLLVALIGLGRFWGLW
jgi:hypothetical protein